MRKRIANFINFAKNNATVIFLIPHVFLGLLFMALFLLTESDINPRHLVVFAIFLIPYFIAGIFTRYLFAQVIKEDEEHKEVIEAARKATTEAKLSEKKYLDLIESTPLCIKVFDENMKMVFLNKGGREEHFIKDTDDISKWSWVGTVKEQYQAEAKEKFQNAFTKGESSTLEFEHTPEGSTHEWCSSLISPIKDKDGKVKSVLFLSSDITDLKKAELRAKQNEQMFKTLLDATPLCIKWFDEKGNLISINKGGREEHFLEKLSDEEIKKWDYMNCVDADYRDEVKEKFEAALKGIEGNILMKHVPGTSKSIWCQSELIPVKNDKNEIIYVLFLSKDVTQEKMIEEERKKNQERAEETKIALFNILEDIKQSEIKLKEERDKIQTIISSIGEGLVVINNDYKIILMNNVAEKFFGILINEAEGKDLKNVVNILKGEEEIPDNEQPAMQVLKFGKAVGAGVNDNFYAKVSSGKKIPIGFIISPLRKDGVIIAAIIIFRDITEEKSLDEAKSNFISISSHQLRTPLTSMRWFAEMLIGGDAGPITEEQKHFVERIYQATERMINLVNLLLQLARVEAGRLKVEPMLLNLENLTQSVAISLKADLDKKSQKVEIVVNPDPFPEILLDQEIIWQVIQNLISNASRYSPEGKNIQVSIIKKDGLVECSVKNQGIGIPKSQKDKIFERFFRADNALKMVPEGSGLGLSLVKLLVEEWGGKIWFDSEENKGATFFFTIPVGGMKKKEGEVKLAV